MFRAEALVNPMNRLASVADEPHRLGFAHTGPAKGGDDGDAFAMKAEMTQANLGA